MERQQPGEFRMQPTAETPEEAVSRADCLIAIRRAANLLERSQFIHYRRIGQRLHAAAEFLTAFWEFDNLGCS
jgi:hypothetical protein